MAGWRLDSAVLGVLALMASVSVASDCPSSKLVIPSCDCESGSNGGYDYWCPNRLDHTVTVTYTARQMTVECNPEANIGAADVPNLLKDASVPALDLLVVRYCPLPQGSFAGLINGAKQSLKELRLELRLDPSEINGTRLVAGQFEGLSALETLRIQDINRKLTDIEPGAFQGLSSLKRLFLTNLQLSSISPDILAPLKNLLFLDLMISQLQELPEEFLASQEKLKYFRLSASAIEALPAKLFHNVTTLESVELKINFSSGSLPASLFDNTHSLKNITVNGNGLEFVSESFFANTSLEYLNWSLYKCAEGSSCSLAPRAFTRNISSLLSFSFTMANNVNVRFPEDMFLGCTKMRNMALKFTDTTGLPKSLFASNRELRSLDLQNNKLTNLPDELLDGLTKLEALKLNNNNLTFVRARSLSDLSLLRSLNLRKNLITGIDNSAFVSTVRLEELDLSENKISFDEDIQHKWKGLTALKVLKLAKNEIAFTHMPYDLTILNDLRTLDLSNNRIGPFIEAESLNFIQKDIVVSLSNNKIKNVRFDHLATMYEKKGPRSNRILLSGNPVECDCSAFDLFRAFKEQPDNLGFKLDGTGLKCAEPESLRNQSVATVSQDDLSCSFPGSNDYGANECPAGCKCSFTPSLSRTLIDCSGAGHNTLPKFVPLISEAKHIYFNLSNNHILTMKDAANAVGNYSNITDLDLSNNRIREISRENLPQNLSGIALDGNNITTLSEEVLTMSGLQWIRLGRNKYECGCQSKHLYDFLRTNSSKVKDIESITLTCEGKSTMLLKMELDNFCPSSGTIILHLILPLIIALVVLLAIVVVILYYKTPICIYLYAKPMLRWIILCIDPDSDVMEYDVFVSYCEEDKDFVEKTLLSELEGSSDIQYRCLVHVRNFVPGRNIVEQIEEAVDRSRRTLVVLSRNFVKSDWYKHEFNLAHSANRVVVVVLGELPTKDEMGDLMWQYINTNTYLPYGGEDDKWFWNKLRYSLPHKNEAPFRFLRRNASDQIALTENKKASPLELNNKLDRRCVVEIPQ